MIYAVSALLGLIFGSFANVCILRLPKDESLVFPASHCPHCGKALAARHNIPLISFIVLKGRCSHCKAKISWQYPAIEAGFLGLFVFHAWFFGDRIGHLVLADMLGFYCLCISVIDYRHRIIPDELSLSLLALGILFSVVNPFLQGPLWARFLQSAGACLGGGLLMMGLATAGEKAFKKEALGGGDVKLIAAMGAALGWIGIVGPLTLGSLSGGGTALVLLILRKKKLGETLPFGPFLCLGAYLATLFPHFWLSLFAL